MLLMENLLDLIRFKHNQTLLQLPQAKRNYPEWIIKKGKNRMELLPLEDLINF